MVSTRLYRSMIKDELQDDGLLSLEKLDRASPDLWPEKIPGITDFIAMSDTPIRTPAPEWSRGLSQEDMSAMLGTYRQIELSSLKPDELIMEIKKIYDEAYQLGVSEAKEMTRGKYLGIFNNAKKKTV
ncbi:protein lin-52 homolog isoform X2 [Lucilia cuprina]|uniref:protein lin-52 homolog isoform X2 n=1 Tax=Lucilia cuprina TaxID=7375 RepID=UPI001F06997B|nr:protein lin-52 homolog isoform X2 [Lucilia cuprina]